MSRGNNSWTYTEKVIYQRSCWSGSTQLSLSLFCAQDQNGLQQTEKKNHLYTSAHPPRMCTPLETGDEQRKSPQRPLTTGSTPPSFSLCGTCYRIRNSLFPAGQTLIKTKKQKKKTIILIIRQTENRGNKVLTHSQALKSPATMHHISIEN